MHFSYSNKSIHYLNQDKHIYQDAHREKCIGVSAEHASAEHASAECQHASARAPKPMILEYFIGMGWGVITSTILEYVRDGVGCDNAHDT